MERSPSSPRAPDRRDRSGTARCRQGPAIPRPHRRWPRTPGPGTPDRRESASSRLDLMRFSCDPSPTPGRRPRRGDSLRYFPGSASRSQGTGTTTTRSPRWPRSPASSVGRRAIRRLARVTAMAAITAPLSSRAAAADRSLEAPAPGHRDRTIRPPASHPTRAMECQSSEVWSRPAGARKSRGRMLLSGLGPAPPGYTMPPHSGLGCKGPE